MSRFFHTNYSSSNEDSSDDHTTDFSAVDASDSDSGALSDPDDNDSATGRAGDTVKAAAPRTAFSKFLRDEESSDEEGGGKRVVRSAKQKLFDDMRAAIKSLDKAKSDNSWTTIQTEFDKLVKQVAKAHAIIRDHGSYPGFYLKFLVGMEEFLQSAADDKSSKKKMSGVEAKAMTAMKQKIRKHNKTMERELEAWKLNPVDTDNEAAPAELDKMTSDLSREESSDSDSDDEPGVNRWKKKTAPGTHAAPLVVKKEKKVVIAAPSTTAEGDVEEDGFTVVSKGKPVKQEQPVTSANLESKLREQLELRGKKSTDTEEQIRVMEKLLTVAATPVQEVMVLLALISARFDSNQGVTNALSTTTWKATEQSINRTLDLLIKEPLLTLQENVDEEITAQEDMDPAEKLKPLSAPKAMRGSLVALVSRLDEEFTKSLQTTDSQTMDYIDRLKDEVSLYALISRANKYCASINDRQSVTLLQSMRLEHIYYKYNSVIILFEESIRKTHPELGPAPTDADQLIHELCVDLYKHGRDRMCTRTALCNIYHHALNKRFYEARDLLLMTHLQDTIQQADIPTQVLYNRTMTQIGICAFRNGMIREAHQSLNEIMASLKSKDILAQGTQLQRFSAQEVDKKERQRVLPFHMHINLELMESIQLTVSMLLEIPTMAATQNDTRKKVASKHFRRLLDFSDRQVFTGPPETPRDHIMQAARALADGNWQKCRDLLVSIKSWQLLPESQSVKEMLVQKIKEEALRTFIFTSREFYDAVSMSSLATQFELSLPTVYAIISKMIINEELHATIDQSSAIITLQRVDPSRLQYLALHASDKTAAFAEGNEKLFDFKFNQHSGSVDDDQQQQQSSYQQRSTNQRSGYNSGNTQRNNTTNNTNYNGNNRGNMSRRPSNARR